MSKYSEEVERFIIENHKGVSQRNMTRMVNEKFNLNISKEQIRLFYKAHNLNSGLTGQFVKGCTSFNKGKKQSEYMSADAIERTKATRFKKGNTPINHKPVGTERIDRDGYIMVKVAEPNKWKLKHRMVWEEAHGEVPKGYIVIFKDQNKMNCELNNLMLITRAVHVRMCQKNLYSTDQELTESGVALANLMLVISDKKKGKGNKND